MRGGHRRSAAGKAAVDAHGRERQALPHRRARAVHAAQRHAELPQGEGGADALVQKVAGKDEVQLLRPARRLLQRAGKHALLHTGLALLPGLFAEEGILAQLVKIVRQRALSLQLRADVGKALHARRT